MRIALLSSDHYNRVVAEAYFSRTWRWSDVTDSRVYGWRLLDGGFGHDFGDARFFFDLPKGCTRGIVSGDGRAWAEGYAAALEPVK